MKWSMWVCETKTCWIFSKAVGGLAVDAPEVEEHGPALVAQSHVQARVAERRVHQARDECGFHGFVPYTASRRGEGRGVPRRLTAPRRGDLSGSTRYRVDLDGRAEIGRDTGEFGVRSELDVYVDGAEAVVTGEPVQQEVVAILGR